MSQAIRELLAAGELAGSRYALVWPQRAPAGLGGSLLGRRPGSSMDFMEHREYQPGDDLRHLDWNAYARTDRAIVKLYREEVTPHVDLLLDTSPSMSLESTEKERATLGIAAAIAAAAGNASFSHALWIAGEGVTRFPGGSERPGLWENLVLNTPTSIHDALVHGPPTWRGFGIRVLVSDLLWSGDPLSVLHPIAHRAAAIHVVQVLARSDREPPPPGNYRMIDSETGASRDLFIDAAAQRRYTDAFTRHEQLWHAACRQVGATLTTLIAEDVVAGWDLGALVHNEVLKVS